MNTPTPTPRTDMATYPADCLGTTLVTNRDCSRALERELVALTAERDKLRAEAERTDANYQRACEVEQELRDEVKRMTRYYEYDHKCLYEVQGRCELWKQRAQKAEADAERYRLVTLRQDAELAAERARLDWLLLDVVSRFDDAYYTRAAIDAGLKEDAK